MSYVGAYLLLRRRSQVGFNGMLRVSYISLGQIALVEWLAGGHGSPYYLLFLIAALALVARPSRTSRPGRLLVSEIVLQGSFTVLLAATSRPRGRVSRRVQATVAEHCSLEDGSTLSLRFGAAGPTPRSWTRSARSWAE
jgi:hypothetical protein